MTTVTPQTSRPEADVDQVRSTVRLQRWLGRHHWALPLLAYTILSLALAYSALADLNHTIIGSGDGDDTWFAWSLWLFRHALLSGQDPTHTHYIAALLPSVQNFLEAFFDELVAFPLQWVMSPIGAYDVTLVLGFILSGLTMYLLAHELVANRLACFSAGFLYDFSTFHFARAQEGHLGLATMQWLPFCAWRLFALYRRPSATNAVLAGLGLALVPFSDVYYLAYFDLPFAGLFVLWVAVTDRGWFVVRRNLRMAGLAMLVAAAIAGPYLATFAVLDSDIQATNAWLSQATIGDNSGDLVAFLLPNSTNPIFGQLSWPAELKTELRRIEEGLFLGYPALLLAAICFRFRRNRNRVTLFWAAVGAVGLLLALGPELQVAGHSVLPLPFYKLVYGWSALSSFRAPSRLGVLPVMALAVLAAFAIDGIMDRLGVTRARIVALTGVVLALLAISLAENVYSSLTLASAQVPVSAVYQQIARERSHGLLLDIPIGFILAERYQYFQTVHQKPLVFGAAPRPTDRMYASVLERPYLAQFFQAGFPPGGRLQGPTPAIYPQSLTFRQQLQEDHVRYVVLHRFDIPPGGGWVRPYVERNLGKPFYRNDSEGLMAWRVGGKLPNNIYWFGLGSGWIPETTFLRGKPMHAVQQDGQIIISAPGARRRTVRFDAFAYFRALSLEVRLNGATVARIRFDHPSAIRSVTLPNLSLKRGLNTLELHAVEGCGRVSDYVPQAQDPRCFSFGVQNVRWGAQVERHELSGLRRGPAGCFCSIDSISSGARQYRVSLSGNRARVSVPKGVPLVVAGWAVDAYARTLAGAVFLTVDDRQNYRATYGGADPGAAQAVARLLKEPEGRYVKSGYTASIPTGDLPAGKHYLTIKIVDRAWTHFYEPSPRIELDIRTS